MTDAMNIDLEVQCLAAHKWELAAQFRYQHLAADAARALSKLDGCKYRTVDRRWPDEGDMVILYEGGNAVDCY